MLQCLNADELLSAAGVSPSNSHLSVENFMHVCPILIVQLDSHVCDNDDAEHNHDHDEESSGWHSSDAAGM